MLVWRRAMVDGKNLLSKNDLIIVHSGIMYDACSELQIYAWYWPERNNEL